MIKIENVDVWGFEHAVRGMRNPKNSWDRSDSKFENGTVLGDNDIKLMQSLFKGGTEHRKYLRQIFASVDITAPLYWWKEFDTYKVGTVSNSCSTMHKLTDKEFAYDDFSHDHLYSEPSKKVLVEIIIELNRLRERYLKTKDKQYWYEMIQLLPSSYNQKRTITMNYENVFTILKQRRGHKLDEWNYICDVFEQLPYVKKIGGM